MVGKTLQLLLDEKGINANELANMIGVSNQTLYSIIKRDNTKIDIQVLIRICEALNVSPERFYNEYTHDNDMILLTPHEKKVIRAYRQHINEQATIDKILDVEPEVAEQKKHA